MASFTPNPTDPNNVEVKKGFVFNETGNIMMATTDMDSAEIEKSVRDVFAEVSVFFGAMTKALDKAGKSLYDYDALQKIIDESGCFVHVQEEDITHKSNSWGANFSQELVKACLGLATGTGGLAFAKAMVSSVGKEGVNISGNSNHQTSKASNIIFVCEYLLGMPVISAIVITCDTSENSQALSIGPCIKEQSTSTTLKLHKDTYMFVTPAFIHQYSQDLVDGLNDPEFSVLTQKFDEYLGVTAPTSGSNTP
tara:strand:- start:207 stop:962 length:756 start_codon:yes stop_codon:yes gene_type:complete